MKGRALVIALIATFPLFAKGIVPTTTSVREQIPFEPWYSGPLVGVTAWNCPPHQYFVNPYAYIQSSSGSRSYQNSLWFQTGLTNWLDTTLVANYFINTKKGKRGAGWSDTGWRLGFKIMEEEYFTLKPSVRLVVQELFPTGKYDSLNPKKLGVDALGFGSYQTLLLLAISKTFFWLPYHPIHFLLDAGVNLPSPVSVRGYNAYGGGRGTKGRVKPGPTAIGDIAFEWSFTQKFVYAMDIWMTAQGPTRFSGKKGVTVNGAPAVNTSKANQQVSLSPSLEYNFTANSYFLGGVWFSVYSHNIPDFVTLGLSFGYIF